MTVTFTNPENNTTYGSVEITPTSINVQNDLWWLLNLIFPTGLFPYLDPSTTFMQFRKLPHQVMVHNVGPVRIFKS